MVGISNTKDTAKHFVIGEGSVPQTLCCGDGTLNHVRLIAKKLLLLIYPILANTLLLTVWIYVKCHLFSQRGNPKLIYEK